MSVDQTALRNLAVVAVAFLARNIAQLARGPSERAYTPPFLEQHKKTKFKKRRSDPNQYILSLSANHTFVSKITNQMNSCSLHKVHPKALF